MRGELWGYGPDCWEECTEEKDKNGLLSIDATDQEGDQHGFFIEKLGALDCCLLTRRV